MGLFKKITTAAGYGGDQICKYCKQKKTVMSSVCCFGTTTKHKWINPEELDEKKEDQKKESSGGVGKWLLKQATKPYKK